MLLYASTPIMQELVYGWPVDELERQALSVQAHQVMQAVGLKQFPVATPLKQLSGGYKRRVALAVQLVRRPAVCKQETQHFCILGYKLSALMLAVHFCKEGAYSCCI